MRFNCLNNFSICRSALPKPSSSVGTGLISTEAFWILSFKPSSERTFSMDLTWLDRITFKQVGHAVPLWSHSRGREQIMHVSALTVRPPIPSGTLFFPLLFFFAGVSKSSGVSLFFFFVSALSFSWSSCFTGVAISRVASEIVTWGLADAAGSHDGATSCPCCASGPSEMGFASSPYMVGGFFPKSHLDHQWSSLFFHTSAWETIPMIYGELMI